jgi:hypothetical protein
MQSGLTGRDAPVQGLWQRQFHTLNVGRVAHGGKELSQHFGQSPRNFPNLIRS